MSSHGFDQLVGEDRVSHHLQSLRVPDLSATVETRSPEAVAFMRDLEKARRELEFREGKELGLYAVPKPGAKAKTAHVELRPHMVCPDCDGWGEMSDPETDKRVTCPHCHGARWILRP